MIFIAAKEWARDDHEQIDRHEDGERRNDRAEDAMD
jgi:hypothetical protein